MPHQNKNFFNIRKDFYSTRLLGTSDNPQRRLGSSLCHDGAHGRLRALRQRQVERAKDGNLQAVDVASRRPSTGGRHADDGGRAQRQRDADLQQPAGRSGRRRGTGWSK